MPDATCYECRRPCHHFQMPADIQYQSGCTQRVRNKLWARLARYPRACCFPLWQHSYMKEKGQKRARYPPVPEP